MFSGENGELGIFMSQPTRQPLDQLPPPTAPLARPGLASPRSKRNSNRIVPPLKSTISPIFTRNTKPHSFANDYKAPRPTIPHSSLSISTDPVTSSLMMPRRIHDAWTASQSGDAETVEVDEVTVARMTAEADRCSYRMDLQDDIYHQHSCKQTAARISLEKERISASWAQDLKETQTNNNGGTFFLLPADDDVDDNMTAMRVDEELDRMRARLLRSAAGEGDLRVVSESDGEMFKEHAADHDPQQTHLDMSAATSDSDSRLTLLRASSFRKNQDLNTLLTELNTAADIVYQGQLPTSARGRANFLSRAQEAGMKSATTELDFAFRMSMEYPDSSDED